MCFFLFAVAGATNNNGLSQESRHKHVEASQGALSGMSADEERLRFPVAQSCTLGSASQLTLDGQASPLQVSEAGAIAVVVGMGVATTHEARRIVKPNIGHQLVSQDTPSKSYHANLIPVLLCQCGSSITPLRWNEISDWVMAKLRQRCAGTRIQQGAKRLRAPIVIDLDSDTGRDNGPDQGQVAAVEIAPSSALVERPPCNRVERLMAMSKDNLVVLAARR